MCRRDYWKDAERGKSKHGPAYAQIYADTPEQYISERILDLKRIIVGLCVATKEALPLVGESKVSASTLFT